MSRRGLRMRILAVTLGAAALVLSGAGAASAASADPAHTVLSLGLTGVVDPFMASYVQRGITRANESGDAAVLITIDTPGGLDSSMRAIVQAIAQSKVPVVCFVSPTGARAASAGTFVMMACPITAMAPGTNIGAAHPVGVSGVIESKKVTNDASAYIQSLAERWGRNAVWAKRAVIDAVSVPQSYAVAHGIVDLAAADVPDLLRTVGACGGTTAAGGAAPTTGLLATRTAIPAVCGATVTAFHMTLAEALFHGFADPNVAFLLLEIGFLALLVWVFHPGLHLSLAIGVIFTVIGFAILQTLPVQLTGFVLLIVSGVLFVLDVKAHAHGVLTAGGIVTLILGGLMLFNPDVPSARVSLPLLIVVAAAAAVFMATVLRSLLAAREAPVVAGQEALVGLYGVALTALAPRGTVRVRGETWTAESPNTPAAPGAPVRVVGARGVHLIVEPSGGAPPTLPDAPQPPARAGTGIVEGPERGNG